jgi:glucose-6-phosphate isomerase
MSLEVKFEYYPKISIENLEKSLDIVKKNKEKWEPPFFIDTKSYLDINKIKQISQPFMQSNINNIIVLGTGGSIQTLMAMKHLSHKKIFPITSSRAVELKHCLDNTTSENSVVIPISRGGETLDINSTIGIFVKKGYRFLALSSQGTMFEMLKKIDCPILDVPDLSGRFAGSISNVAIVPAYLSNIDINNFLKGLDEGYHLFMNQEINPALEFSVFLYNLYKKGYKVVFSMPYSKNIEGSVGLFVQEISESTGKEEKGLMGAYQSAPLCQHSVLEYLLGGTKGAVIPILWIINNENPDLVLESSIDYINHQKAQTIINYQADATFQALLEQSVPSAKISINNPDEFDIGQLISFIQSTIYYLCLMLDVNWASNPKVVVGKKICNEALKKKISVEERKNIRAKLSKESFKEFYY